MDWQIGQQRKYLSQKKVQENDATSAKVCFALSVLLDQSEYRPQEREQAHNTGAKENSEVLFITLEGRSLMLEKAAAGLVRLAHDITHLGKTSLQGLLQKYLPIPQLATLTQLASKSCLCCTQHNPGQEPRPPLLVQKRGSRPLMGGTLPSHSNYSFSLQDESRGSITHMLSQQRIQARGEDLKPIETSH
jgi:hypothetical protein